MYSNVSAVLSRGTAIADLDVPIQGAEAVACDFSYYASFEARAKLSAPDGIAIGRLASGSARLNRHAGRRDETFQFLGADPWILYFWY